MRCPACNKFVPYSDEPETDEIQVDLDSDTITLSGTLYLTCGECGIRLKSAEMEMNQNLEDLFSDIPEEFTLCEIVYELDGDPEITPTDRMETKDRHGNTITKTRFMKRFYGVEATVNVTRKVVGEDGEEIPDLTETQEANLSCEEQASGFDECC